MLVQSAANPCVMLSPAAAILTGSGGAVVLVVEVVDVLVDVLVLEVDDVLVVDEVLVVVVVLDVVEILVELLVDDVELVVVVEEVVDVDVLDDEVEDVLVVVVLDEVVEVTLVLVVVVDTPPGQTPSNTGRIALNSLLPSLTTWPSDPNCTL
jgi:hypothetical protein